MKQTPFAAYLTFKFTYTARMYNPSKKKMKNITETLQLEVKHMLHTLLVRVSVFSPASVLNPVKKI